jgi:hypothetical protein
MTPPLNKHQRAVLTAMVVPLSRLQQPCHDIGGYMTSIHQTKLAFLSHMVAEAIADVKDEYAIVMELEADDGEMD